MKLTTYISASAFIFISALVIRNKEARNQSESLYEHKWVLEKVHEANGMRDVQTNAFIRFNETKQSAGGNGSCNSFGSSISIQGNTIKFSQLFSTKMYCEGVQDVENAFLKHLSSANRYEVKNEELKLYNDKQLLLEFSAQ